MLAAQGGLGALALRKRVSRATLPRHGNLARHPRSVQFTF
jgi:hypothetical protein